MRIYLREFSSEALILIVIGVFIWLSNLGIFIFNFRRDWPVILIIIGVMEIFNGLFRPGKSWVKFGSKTKYNPEMEKEEINKVLSELSSGKVNSDDASDRIRDIREKFQE